MKIQLPTKLKALRDKSRYKVLYGGRGGAKSWGVAIHLILEARKEKLLILCTRELQKSIQESVHRILASQIERMGLDDFFEIQKSRIIGQNGSEFIFEGLRNNPAAIKSMEGIDRVWVEEAEAVSEFSWDVLIPTIRKPNSQIFITFNPNDELDPTYQRFVISPPGDATLININYWDNPFFDEPLKSEMEECKERDQRKYKHIWCGEPNADYEDSVIQPEWFEAAIDAHKKLGFEGVGIQSLAFDPADSGDAKATAMRHGSIVESVREWDDGDIELAVQRAFDEAFDHRCDEVIYDNVGLGAAVKMGLDERIKGKSIKVYGFGGGERVDYPEQQYENNKSNKDSFKNKRAQYYWLLRDRFYKTWCAVNKGKYSDPDDLISLSSDIAHLKDLKRELCKIKRVRRPGLTQVLIESKEEIKRETGKSPNMADALMMVFAGFGAANDEDVDFDDVEYTASGWMA